MAPFIRAGRAPRPPQRGLRRGSRDVEVVMHHLRRALQPLRQRTVSRACPRRFLHSHNVRDSYSPCDRTPTSTHGRLATLAAIRLGQIHHARSCVNLSLQRPPASRLPRVFYEGRQEATLEVSRGVSPKALPNCLYAASSSSSRVPGVAAFALRPNCCFCITGHLQLMDLVVHSMASALMWQALNPFGQDCQSEYSGISNFWLGRPSSWQHRQS